MWILLPILLENVCSSSISITGIQNSATGLRSTIRELASGIYCIILYKDTSVTPPQNATEQVDMQKHSHAAT